MLLGRPCYTTLFAGAALVTATPQTMAAQLPLGVNTYSSEGASIKIGSVWEALGPFPSGTREHPLISSPSYAFLPNRSTHYPDITFAQLPYGWSPLAGIARGVHGSATAEDGLEVDGRGWPSPLGPDGEVGWGRFETGEDGYTEVSYSDIRWEQTRSHQGWAAMQYHAMLRTTVTITPSSSSSLADLIPLNLELIQAQEFALIPTSTLSSATTKDSEPITWYNGDIYSYALELATSDPSPSAISPYAHQLLLPPGEYTLVVKALYEIRMFGDPKDGVPRIKFFMRGGVRKEGASSAMGLKLMEELDLVADVMDGVWMGSHIGLGIQRALGSGGKEGEKVEVEIVGVKALPFSEDGAASVTFSLMNVLNSGRGLVVRLFEGQVRVLALGIDQIGVIPDNVKELSLEITARQCTTSASGETTSLFTTLSKRLPLKHIPHFTSPSFDHTSGGIQFTHLSPHSSPIYTMLIPPLSSKPYPANESEPSILYFHGAGVEVVLSADTMEAVPRRQQGWAVVPTGGTSWGMDWHGATMESAIGGLETGRKWMGEKFAVKEGEEGWSWGAANIAVGHSNGGQGAWHITARYPDKFLGVLPAAGYLKIQDYVPYQAWTSDHYADPALIGLLKSSLTPFNNDLYASNLAHVPLHAVHGQEDDNVPVWHSRRHLGLVGSWTGGNLSDTSFEEVPGGGHWFPGIIGSSNATEFLKYLAGYDMSARAAQMFRAGFTVTTANPDESGGKGGIRIYGLDVPGRLARIDVRGWGWLQNGGKHADIKTSNVKTFILKASALANIDSMAINGKVVDTASFHGRGEIVFEKSGKQFNAVSSSDLATQRPYGPMIRILSSPRPAAVIFGTLSSKFTERLKSIAVRLAHDALVYQRIEMEILDDKTALELAAKGALDDRNVIVLGSPFENMFAAWMAGEQGLPATYPIQGIIELGDRLFYEDGTGFIFLTRHPNVPQRMSCFLTGTDAAGLEAAFRLFPVRTGVPIPDWAVIGSKAKWQGAGGFLGAGFWDNKWELSEAMTWLA